MFHSVAGSIAGAAVGVAFWAFVAVSAVAGMRYDLRKRQLAMESLRALIERGEPLEPALVERLLAQHHGPQVDRPQDLEPYLQIGGVITVAAGVGLIVAGWLVGLQFPVAKLPILGVGSLAVCVGIGVRVAARVLRRYRSHDPSGRGT